MSGPQTAGLRRYIFKLYPTPAQADRLHEHRKMTVDLWNALKQRREDVWSREHRSLSFFDLTNEITGLRHECPEWREVPAITAHRVAKQLTDAYAAFFRRLKAGEPDAGYPRWHSRSRATTIPLGTMTTTGWRVEQRSDNPLSWRLHYGSITRVKDPGTWIHARGVLPARIADWRNADIIWRDTGWWLSICVEAAARRLPGRAPARVEFDLLDDFARVNGRAETPEGLRRAQILQDRLDALKSEHDLRWPRGQRRSDGEQGAFLRSREELSRLSGFIARVRRDALHVWTARIVAGASDLTIVAPAVKRNTQSPRGDRKSWGAAVEVVGSINRNTLSQAPASAIAMLQYKSAEAGIRCDLVTDAAPAIVVGRDLVAAGITLRRARRATRERKVA